MAQTPVPMPAAATCAPGFQVGVEAVGHGDTRYRRFWLGAFGQNLGLEGCAAAPPDELLGVFFGVHLSVVGGNHPGQSAGLNQDGWPDAYATAPETSQIMLAHEEETTEFGADKVLELPEGGRILPCQKFEELAPAMFRYIETACARVANVDDKLDGIDNFFVS